MPETGHFYEFENFRLDPVAKILFRDDAPVPLTPKVFETLLVFVEHAGRLLEKDELMRTIWQDRFVEESNLTFNIRMLRRALDDDAHEPRFIETVPRRGYRFIAEVKTHFPEVAASMEAIAPVANSSIGTRQNRYAMTAGLALVVAGLVFVAFWIGRHYVPVAVSAPLLSLPFKSEPFSATGRVHAVITPDGKYVAYTGETEGKENIWLRQLATSENIQIVPPADYYYLGLAVSHDGNALYFVRRQQTGQSPSALYRVMTFGGIPVKLVENLEGWVSLSPDDRQISFVRCTNQVDDSCSLFVIGADGKDERRILTRRPPLRIADNQFSPDGRSIAFAAGQSLSGGSDFRLLRVDLTTGVESEISSKTFFNIRNLKWLPSGDGLLLAAKETLDGRIRIWQVSTRSGGIHALTKDATDYVSLSLDQMADKMIATQISNSFHLYLAPIDDLKSLKTLSTARISFAFGPDDRIVYSGSDGNIWSISKDGSGQRQLTNDPATEFSPRTSPDGRYIFFASNRSGSNQVWRMNADGSNQTQLTKVEGGYPRYVTNDGQWLYYESGLHQTLWRVATSGGEELQISDARVPEAAFSANGALVAYLYHSEHDKRSSIAIMSVGSRKVESLFAVPGDQELPLKIAWSPDNKTLNYITVNGLKHSLWRQSLDHGQPQLLADLGNEEVADFAISPDGKNLALIRGKWVHDAVLIEGLK